MFSWLSRYIRYVLLFVGDKDVRGPYKTMLLFSKKLSRYNKRNNPPFLHVGCFHMALIHFIEGHIAFKGNRAQASALIGSEMFRAEWLIGVVCLKHQFKYVLPPIYPFIFSPLRGSARGPKSQRCEAYFYLLSNSSVLFILCVYKSLYINTVKVNLTEC